MVNFMRARGGGLLAAGAILGLAALVQAQSIRIPDLSRASRVAAPAPRPGEPCDGCGVIRAIREVQIRQPIPVPKPLQGGSADRGQTQGVLVGAVVALPAGEGSQGSRPFVGGVGTPEMRDRFMETTYEIVVRFDNGAFTTLQRRDGWGYYVGDRVRVRGVQMELLGPLNSSR